MKLTANYWEERYIQENIPWDAGNITTPLKNLFDSLANKNLRILIPGCGSGHEAAYLFKNGFSNVHVCDWSLGALENLKRLSPSFPENQMHCQDFFTLELSFDLIVEQTFFCAIDPSLRPKYVQKTDELLVADGKICGLLFAKPFERQGPPFGGNPSEYRTLFSERFNILKMGIAEDSITPRQGTELYIEFQKK